MSKQYTELIKSSYLFYVAAVAIPITLGSYFWPVGKKAGEGLPQRPPAITFAIVWPILYLLIAYAWWKGSVISSTPEIFNIKYIMPLFIALMVLWEYLYYQKKVWGLWCFAVMLPVVLGILIQLFLLPNKTAAWSFIPVVGWLLFAYMLNFGEIYF